MLIIKDLFIEYIMHKFVSYALLIIKYVYKYLVTVMPEITLFDLVNNHLIQNIFRSYLSDEAYSA